MSVKRWYHETNLAEAALVILHPNFADQHLLLPPILDQANCTPICLTLQNSPTDLAALWGLLTMALAFQANINLPALSPTATVPSAAGVFLKAVKGLKRFILSIDAFDLADSSVIEWVEALVGTLPAGSQIVVGGRQVPLPLLNALQTSTKVVLFPTDNDRMLLDYAEQDKSRKLLEVYGHGNGRVLVNGRLIDRWDGTLPRSLFFYFVDRGMATRDEIFSMFWPDLPVREATNVFHVTKRKISEILDFDLTIYWSGFYRISPDIDLHYDVVKFAENVQNAAVADQATATTMLQRALDLYHGTFLTGINFPWVAKRREDLQGIYVEALTSLGRINDNKGQHEQALGLYLRAARSYPLREDLARSIMNLYRKLDQPQQAIRVYDRLVSNLKAQLNVAPDRRTSELADQIRKLL